MGSLPHGTTGRYRYGCRCADCKEAASAYNRQHYVEGPTKPVTDPGPQEPGPTELATAAQLATMSRAAAEPALAAGALELARLLDGDKAISAKPMAMKQLVAVLGELKKGSDQRKQGLAGVRSLSRPDKAAG